MIVAVQDANVLIDLANAGLLDRLPLPGFDFCVLDAVLGELLDAVQRAAVDTAIASGCLRVCSMSSAETERAATLRHSDERLSLPDVLSLGLAQSRGGILLTGDRPLRELAESLGVETHGVLWVLEHLVRGAGLSPSDAMDALDAMLAQGSRLPSAECTRLRNQWSVSP